MHQVTSISVGNAKCFQGIWVLLLTNCIDREKRSVAVQDGSKRMTDFLIHYRDLEISCGEVKPPGTTISLQVLNCVRVTELMKVYLY